jgi:hypothetical protein
VVSNFSVDFAALFLRINNLTSCIYFYVYCNWSVLCSAVAANELGSMLGMNSLIFVVVVVSTVLILCAAIVALAVCICRRDSHQGRPPHLQSTQQQPPNASYPCKSHTYCPRSTGENINMIYQPTVAFHSPPNPKQAMKYVYTHVREQF